LLLGLAGGTQLHGTAALALACGFLAPLAGHSCGLALSGGCTSGLGGTGQGGLQHDSIVLTGKATGLCGQRIIVFADDVHPLPLLLW
jgi:hypothetical protein